MPLYIDIWGQRAQVTIGASLHIWALVTIGASLHIWALVRHIYFSP